MAEMEEWDATMELLPHVHTLRLSLSPPPHSKLSLSSPSLSASLQAPPPRLRCSWCRRHPDPSLTLTLTLPLPPLLYDYSAPVHVSVQNGDCVEIRLQLLPVHHLQASSLVSPQEDKKSSNGPPHHPAFDARMLSSLGDVVFYCRCCSKRLLKDPVRDNNIVEMPSVDWREVADSWFGPCCCSFGAQAELLVSQFKSQFSFGKLKERLGICLVGPASCYIHCGNIMPGCLLEKDLEAATRDRAVETTPDSKNKSRSCRDDVVTILGDDSCLGDLIPKEPSSSLCFEHCDGNVGSDEPVGCASHELFNILKRVGEREEEFLIPDSCLRNSNPEESSSSPCLEHDRNVGSDELAGCASHGHFNIPKSVGEREEEFLIPGSGFIIRESEHSNFNKWAPLHCSNCSCLVGVSSSKDLDSGPGLHFFKFRISTSEVSGSEEDIFRVLKLENSVVKELQLLSDENTLYRYVVHSLNSKLPRLQLVVLNFNSWMCSRTCLVSPVAETESAVLETSTNPTLKPVMKVMFVNCSNFDENAIRAVDDWARKYDAEIIYMLEELVDSLTEVLYANKISLPMLYSGQEFFLSFLERLNEQDLS